MPVLEVDDSRNKRERAETTSRRNHMDGTRFDGFARTLAAGRTRRRALQALAGGTLAGLLGLTGGVEEAAAACVKPGKKGCKGPKNKKCCPGSVCKGGSTKKEGTCKCKGGTTKCGSKCVNTETDKNNCGDCGKKCAGTNSCRDGVCTGTFGCPAGPNYCAAGEPIVLCPGFQGCVCATDVEGGAHCSDSSTAGGGCSNCVRNSDCGPGLICIFGGGDCNCPNGKLCMSATCGPAT